MPSNDFNGDPICILSMGDAIELVNLLVIMQADMENSGSENFLCHHESYNKLVRFVDENSN